MRHGRRLFLLLALAALALGAVVALAPGGAASPRSHRPRAASPPGSTPPGLAGALQASIDGARRRTGEPGVSAAVVSHGRLIWSGVSGRARISPSVPVTPATLFSLASLTKTYTAALTLRLVERGRLRLSDTVGRWLGRRVRRAARPIRVRELLMQTSGLPDYLDTGDLDAQFADPNHRWRQAELLREVRAPRGRGGYHYSNTNYMLLGPIDARAGRGPFGSLLGRLVLRPLGLSDTFIERDPRAAARVAHSYDMTGGRLGDHFARARGVPTDVWGPLFPDGGVVASAADVARFLDALYGGRFLAPATLGRMLRPGPDGSYGMGTYRFSFHGHRFQGHDGAYGGFASDGFTDRRRGLTLAVLVNGLPTDDRTSPVDETFDALSDAVDRAGVG